MRIIYKYVLLLLVINLSLTINSCKSRLEGNTEIYQQAVNLIINNSKDLPLKKEVIFISDETIPFNLETLSLGMVQKKYITDYDEMKKYSEYELKKIDQVRDSLSQKSKLYNLNFKRNQKNAVGPKHNKLSKKTKYVCFFSIQQEDFLYCELRKFDNTINSDMPSSEELSYGTSYSYLFKISNNNPIVLVANGKSYLN